MRFFSIYILCFSSLQVMITALNRNWHPEHFLCELCGRRVGEDGYHEKDGQAYCRDCYMNNFVPKCLGCKQIIIDTYIQALGGHYHKNCFVCQVIIPFREKNLIDFF